MPPADFSSPLKPTQELDTWIPKQIRPNSDSEDCSDKMAQGSDSPPCSDVFYGDTVNNPCDSSPEDVGLPSDSEGVHGDCFSTSTVDPPSPHYPIPSCSWSGGGTPCL